MNETKKFYRVCNNNSSQGLWYDFYGQFTGLIHNEFSFCSNAKLAMEFDEELVGWLSATESIEELKKWFTNEDILALQSHGWFIHEYEANTWKFYDKFQHYVIQQSTSKPIAIIVILVKSMETITAQITL